MHIEFNYFTAMQALEKVEVDYISLPGWKAPIVDCRSFDDLPQNAKDYVLKIEQLLGIPGKYVHEY